MATKAKYTRIQAPAEDNTPKLDTDIIMRFSDRYGTPLPIQASTSDVRSPYSSEKTSPASPSRLLRS